LLVIPSANCFAYGCGAIKGANTAKISNMRTIADPMYIIGNVRNDFHALFPSDGFTLGYTAADDAG
jgi:hypothetical protein